MLFNIDTIEKIASITKGIGGKWSFGHPWSQIAKFDEGGW